MSRVYVPWTDKPPTRFRGLSAPIAALAVLLYRILGPIIRRFPGMILIGGVVGGAATAWILAVIVQDYVILDAALRDLGELPTSSILGGMWGLLDGLWSPAQLALAAGHKLEFVLPGFVYWAVQGWLVRDVLGIVGIMTIVSLIPAFGIWMERKVSAHIQSRVGPMRVGGWHGWSQSAADGLKLIAKEDFVPPSGDGPLFRLAVYVAMVPTLACFIALPFGALWVFRDLDVALLFILAMLGIEVLSVIMAGWASNNKWSLFGAMREACQVVSYEIPMGMSLLIPVMIAGSLRFTEIAAMQSGGWFTWIAFHSPFAFVAMVTYFIASLASVKRAPFDLPESESELVSGFHTEYSGFRWSLFFFAEYVAMFIVSGLLVILFLGAWHSPIPIPQSWAEGGLTLSWQQRIGLFLASGPLWFILKCMLLLYLQMWLRWTLPRIRIDQVLYSCIQVMLPLVMATLLASTFWELLVVQDWAWFNVLGHVTRFALGGLGLVLTGGMLYVMWYGFSRRKELVGNLAVEILPGS